MKRSLLLLGIGLICGLAVAQLFTFLSKPEESSDYRDGGWVALPDVADESGPVPDRTIARATGGFARRADVYELAGQADRSALEALLEKIAVQPDSPGQRFSAQILLSRYLDIDPDAALVRARNMNLPGSAIAALYAQWAETDAGAALEALQFEQNSSVVQSIGDALIETLGGDVSAIERVVNSLPLNIDPNGFQAAAFSALARRAPEATWQQAGQIDDAQLRLRAQQSIVEVMMEQDPAAALRRAGQIDDRTVRQTASASILQRWARSDPRATLDFLANMGIELPRDWGFITSSIYSEIALAEPMLLLESVDRLPPSARDGARSAAINRWAKLDPQSAVSYVDTLPGGPQKQNALRTVGTAFARVDPEAALAWARSLQPRPQQLLGTVLSSIAVKDPALALSMVDGLDSERDRAEAMQKITIHLASSGQGALIAQRVLGMEDDSARANAMSMLSQIWTSQDPEAALTWYTEHQAEIDAMSMNNFTSNFVRGNPQQASLLIDQVPEHMRSEWISSVASGYAQQDPAAALDWIAQFRGEPGYDAAAVQIVLRGAHGEPEDMIELMETIEDSQLAGQVATRAAHVWAQRDPGSAADWAAGIEDETARGQAVAAVTQQWAMRDADSAQGWILGLPSGLSRDAAITSFVSRRAKSAPDSALLSAYSSDTARQIGVQRAVFSLAGRDRKAAQRLIDDYITDPTLRARAEQAIESSRQR